MALEDYFDDSDSDEADGVAILNQSTVLKTAYNPPVVSVAPVAVPKLLEVKPDPSAVNGQVTAETSCPPPTSLLGFHMQQAKLRNEMWKQRLKDRYIKDESISDRLALLRKADENYAIAYSKDMDEALAIPLIARRSLLIL